MKIAIAGAGIAGLASAALLARAGHDVAVYDQFAAPSPVGSGLMVQPVGMSVLAHLGLADTVGAQASPIRRILGKTRAGLTVLDTAYADLRPDAVGHAVQRSVLFDALLGAALGAGAELVPDTAVTGVRGQRLLTALGDLPPADLVLDCLGAYSPLCPRLSKPLRYGALWALLDWPLDGPFRPDQLEQRYWRAAQMVGVLPVGQRPDAAAKLTFFWSLRGADHAAWRNAPLDDWKAKVTGLWPETAVVLDQIRSHDDLVFARYTHHTVAFPGRGHVAHLGDSHHAGSPQLGQGANMALLDAWALATAVARCPDPQEATHHYAQLRRTHVWFYQAASWAFTPLYQSDSRILPWIRNRIAAPASFIWPLPGILSRLVAGELGEPMYQIAAGR